jgi:hypothetical protein
MVGAADHGPPPIVTEPDLDKVTSPHLAAVGDDADRDRRVTGRQRLDPRRGQQHRCQVRVVQIPGNPAMPWSAPRPPRRATPAELPQQGANLAAASRDVAGPDLFREAVESPLRGCRRGGENPSRATERGQPTAATGERWEKPTSRNGAEADSTTWHTVGLLTCTNIST